MFTWKISIRNIVILLIIVLAIMLALLSFIFLNAKYTRIDVSNDMITEYPDTFAHEFSEKFHFKQNGNDCGPLNAAALLRLRDINVDNQKIVNKTKFRFKNDYTHPWGVEDHFMLSFAYNTSELSEDEKISFLKSMLSSEYAGILLGGTDTYQHYITLLGYENDKFYVYDSLYTEGSEGMTIDSNGDVVGNRSLSNEELLEFWSKGGMYGFYENYVMFVYSGDK